MAVVSFVRVDLKVIEVHAPAIARATGINEDRILAGLLRLWHRCWSVGRASVDRAVISGAFGPDQVDLLVDALSGDFLEKQEDGSFRVRGAEQYLRIKEAQRRAAEATNRAKAERRSSYGIPTVDRTVSHGLTPSTEHRAPKKETTLSSTLDLGPVVPPPETVAVKLAEVLTDDEFDVFEHWRQRLNHPKAVATKERKRLIAKWLPAYGKVRLQAAIDGCARSPHHMGQNDRHTRYDSLELILRDAKHIEDFEAMP